MKLNDKNVLGQLEAAKQKREEVLLYKDTQNYNTSLRWMIDGSVVSFHTLPVEALLELYGRYKNKYIQFNESCKEFGLVDEDGNVTREYKITPMYSWNEVEEDFKLLINNKLVKEKLAILNTAIDTMERFVSKEKKDELMFNDVVNSLKNL